MVDAANVGILSLIFLVGNVTKKADTLINITLKTADIFLITGHEVGNLSVFWKLIQTNRCIFYPS